MLYVLITDSPCLTTDCGQGTCYVNETSGDPVCTCPSYKSGNNCESNTTLLLFILLNHFWHPLPSISPLFTFWGGHDHMVVGFTTTCAISVYHH